VVDEGETDIEADNAMRDLLGEQDDNVPGDGATDLGVAGFGMTQAEEEDGHGCGSGPTKVVNGT